MIRISAHEVMKGHWFPRGYEWPDIPALPLVFKVDWEIDNPPALLTEGGAYAQMDGTIDLGEGPLNCTGDLMLDYFGKHEIRYNLFWREGATPADFRHYQLTCKKSNLRPWNLHRTHTQAKGTIIDRGRWGGKASGEAKDILADVEVHFPMRTALQFLSSIKLERL